MRTVPKIGPARALNATLGGWDGVRITPMFGRWGYFVGDRLFACFPLRDKDHDLWIHLGPGDQARALRVLFLQPVEGAILVAEGCVDPR